MKGTKLIKYASVSVAAFFAFTVAAPAQSPAMAAIDGLQKGAWTLKQRGSNGNGREVCLGDAIKLTQIQHGNANCTRYIIENAPNKLRVSYKCGGLGHGVTEIRRESSGLIQIYSQGIANGAPFSISLEGRRTGPC